MLFSLSGQVQPLFSDNGKSLLLYKAVPLLPNNNLANCILLYVVERFFLTPQGTSAVKHEI